MNSGVNVSQGNECLCPFSKIPDLGGEYIRKLREVEIQYKILQLLRRSMSRQKWKNNAAHLLSLCWIMLPLPSEKQNQKTFYYSCWRFDWRLWNISLYRSL